MTVKLTCGGTSPSSCGTASGAVFSSAIFYVTVSIVHRLRQLIKVGMTRCGDVLVLKTEYYDLEMLQSKVVEEQSPCMTEPPSDANSGPLT